MFLDLLRNMLCMMLHTNHGLLVSGQGYVAVNRQATVPRTENICKCDTQRVKSESETQRNGQVRTRGLKGLSDMSGTLATRTRTAGTQLSTLNAGHT